MKKRAVVKNKLKCIHCLNFKTRTYTNFSLPEEMRVQKLMKIVKERGFVRTYRCSESQLTCEIYIHNETIKKRLCLDCKKAIDMREEE